MEVRGDYNSAELISCTYTPFRRSGTICWGHNRDVYTSFFQVWDKNYKKVDCQKMPSTFLKSVL